jgi:D-alanine-D-alanine ligase
MKKTRVAVIFGGRSGEHEVSLVSATSIIKALNPSKYDVMEIGITLEGVWLQGPGTLDKFKKKDYSGLNNVDFSMGENDKGFDIAFPVLHGPYGEDGTIQGLFEMLNMPYVGCGVLASSTCMDKLQTKAIWEAAGLPVVPYVSMTRFAWAREEDEIVKKIEEKFGYPCFVKPANMGSSVGISKAKNRDSLIKAIHDAAKYDNRILVEQGVDAREIECAVLGNNNPVVSVPGEIIVGGEFYDYFDKYVNGKSSSKIPARMAPKLIDEAKELSLKAYKVLDCSGLARVDSFLDRKTEKFYLNEINTMPGFTSISMYPKMMEAAGLGYEELIDKLIALGFERFEERKKNRVAFDSGSDWYVK